MAVMEMFVWWYARGWHVFVRKLLDMFASIADFFSMGSLIRTLFKPYRQISAETAGEKASLDIKFHMFIDRLISRVVGFFSRLVLIMVGVVVIIVGGVIGMVLMVLWPIIPFLPVAGIVLAVMGVNI